MIVCMPSSVTNLEKRTILDVATASGAGMACLIEEPLAAAIGAGIDIHHPYGTMIVDMGGGTTDIAVITMGSIAISGSVRIAGNEFDEAIMRYVKTYKNVTIGERTAEEIKKQIGCAYIREEEVAMIAKGKNYITGMPESFEISSTEVYEAICDLLDDLFEAVRSILEVTPPELVSDIATQGIILTGGGALLYGMDTMVQKRTGIRARVADDPLHCVVKGTGAALKDMNVLADNGYIFKSREEIVGIKRLKGKIQPAIPNRMAGSVFHSIGFAFLHAAQRSKPAAASKQTRTGEHNISGICKQKHNALRAAEFFGDQSRDHSNAAHQQAGWKIHHGNLAGNRKPAAINHGGNRKDQRQIDNIGADDIAHGEGGLFFLQLR